MSNSDPFSRDPYANGRLDEIHTMLTSIARGHDALRDTNTELSKENKALRSANTALRRRINALTPGLNTKTRPLTKEQRKLLTS